MLVSMKYNWVQKVKEEAQIEKVNTRSWAPGQKEVWLGLNIMF
jgi:hypothetical protein